MCFSSSSLKPVWSLKNIKNMIIPTITNKPLYLEISKSFWTGISKLFFFKNSFLSKSNFKSSNFNEWLSADIWFDEKNNIINTNEIINFIYSIEISSTCFWSWSSVWVDSGVNSISCEFPDSTSVNMQCIFPLSS